MDIEKEREEKWDRRFLKLAEHIATWSLDPSTQVGAVIVDEKNRVVSVGYNGFPKGIEDDARLNNRETKYKMIVHGEMNAILFAKRDLINCTLYTTPFLPCSVCTSNILQTGIVRVVSYFTMNTRWLDNLRISMNLFEEAGIVTKCYKNEV